MMSRRLEVAIIGAGPYGLSIASHLSQRGVDYRLFGTPMHTWRNHMPEGMWLRSEGFASNLADPGGELTLERYCEDHGFDVGGWGVPVPLEVYSGYGEWFVEQAKVPVEDTQVVSLAKDSGGFVLDLATGETLRAAQVVVAVGLTHFRHLPAEFAALPPELFSHSSSVRGGISGATGSQLHPAEFAGRRVTVIGAGQSALENAALLHEHGATVEIAARALSIVWNPPPHPLDRPLWKRLRRPVGGLCTGMGCWLYEHGPRAFHLLPEERRVRLATTTFGPAGAWWLRQRIEGKVPVRLDHHVRKARSYGDEVELEFEGVSGRTTLRSEHVICATGYRVDLARLRFIDAALASAIKTVADYPILDGRFQSTVPGLYFVGAASGSAFGPVVRFVLGARFTARVLERQLLREAGQS
ncbi:MAG TPA: FAD-dependent oxidoreductase [Acidimicrobiia bacterium]|nr:FAD-dependent oxidoreductase [Acidimicrobiia bacterium]